MYDTPHRLSGWLVFLMYKRIDIVISCTLWNPLTTEVRSPIIYYVPVLGFWLEPLTNDYKVVYFHCDCWHKYTTLFYYCSRGLWRILKPKESLSFYTDVKNTFGTAYLNGSYYWMLRGATIVITRFFHSNLEVRCLKRSKVQIETL